MNKNLDRGRRPPATTARPIAEPRFERTELPSGFVVAVAPRPEVPLVDLELVLPAGGDAAPAERPGLARLTSALLDEGTRRRTGRQLAADLERRGGALATSCDWNSASIHLSVPARELAFGLDLVAELLFEPAFAERELERLRRQALAEVARRRDDPAALADEALARGLHDGTVYGAPLLGTAESIPGLTRDEVVAFHRERFRLGRARLVAAGAIDLVTLAASAASALGSAATESVPEPPRVEAPTREAFEIVVVDRPGAAQTELRFGQIGVERTHPDRNPLGFLNSLLGGKFTSRINLNLRERLGITYGAHSRLADRRSPGPYVVGAAVENRAVGLATAEIRAELERIRLESPTNEEVEETRSFLLGVYPYGLQTIQGLAARLRDLALFDLPLDHPRRTLEEFRSISADELRAVAAKHLAPSTALVVAAGPADEIAPQLEAIGAVRRI